ncbi:MAG: 3'-5' exonuclease [Fibrobacteria bacterium]|nr:3'-5' exonuclease [Fibrobacteria bacterium]
MSKAKSETTPNNFVAIDFETADRYRDSACAVALVKVENNQIVQTDYRLIRPPRKKILFTYIHGITWPQVADEPVFAEIWPELSPLLEGADYLAAHNASFDKSVLKACCRSADLAPPDIPFECTVKLARNTWNLYPTKLPDVCDFLGIPLNHHDAMSDALACAKIAIAANQTS